MWKELTDGLKIDLMQGGPTDSIKLPHSGQRKLWYGLPPIRFSNLGESLQEKTARLKVKTMFSKMIAGNMKKVMVTNLQNHPLQSCTRDQCKMSCWTDVEVIFKSVQTNWKHILGVAARARS